MQFLISEVILHRSRVLDYDLIESLLNRVSVNEIYYRGTSLIRSSNPLGTYSKTMSRALW